MDALSDDCHLFLHQVNRRVESEQEKCQNISFQLARCSTTDQLFTGFGQLKTELTSNQQMISERVGGVSSQQLNIQNETVAQLQIVHTTLDAQLANATNQLSTGLNQLRRELTTSQQSSELSHNMTHEELGVLYTFPPATVQAGLPGSTAGLSGCPHQTAGYCH